MTKINRLHRENLQAMLDYGKWLADARERQIQGMQSKAGVLLGFLGVELSVLTKNLTDIPIARYLIGLFLVSAFVTLTLLGLVYFPRKTLAPNFYEIGPTYFKNDSVSLLVAEQFFGINNPIHGHLHQLKIENDARSRMYTYASTAFAITQFLLFSTLVVLYV